jgi:RNA-directed DNA polymerase
MKFKLYRSLCESLSITRSSLTRFSETAPNKYKVYTIPKRTSGQRVIAHPSKKLKFIQKALINELAVKLKSHDAAYAYKKNLSIKDNARVHVNSEYLLKMDFSDFFNSIKPSALFLVCERNNIIWSDAEKRLLAGLLFWNKTKSQNKKLVLSVGAPSSPLISNFVMYDFDCKISEYCQNKKISYSRYADDITFSTNHRNVLFEIPNIVREMLVNLYENQIVINKLKTRFSSKAHNRHVTGITLTNDNQLSLGRARKRLVSSLIHKFKIGILNSSDTFYLQGLLAFCISIEPSFVDRMAVKYSRAIIDNIFNVRTDDD